MTNFIYQLAHWSVFACGIKAILIGSDVNLIKVLRRNHDQ